MEGAGPPFARVRRTRRQGAGDDSITGNSMGGDFVSGGLCPSWSMTNRDAAAHGVMARDGARPIVGSRADSRGLPRASALGFAMALGQSEIHGKGPEDVWGCRF